MASVLEMNKVIMDNYVKEYHPVILSVLSVEDKFQVTLPCANLLIRLTIHHANNSMDKIKLAV